METDDRPLAAEKAFKGCGVVGVNRDDGRRTENGEHLWAVADDGRRHATARPTFNLRRGSEVPENPECHDIIIHEAGINDMLLLPEESK